MQYHRAYRYRFYPTAEQAQQLARSFGCARFIYNWGLRQRTDAWYQRGESMNYHATAKALTLLKKQPETEWLSEVSNVVLQQSLRHLDQAFGRFFKKLADYPAPKRKRGAQSCSYMTNGFVFRDGQLTLAKQKQPLAIRWSRPLPADATITSLTVERDAAHRYFISILVRTDIQPLPPSSKMVALDVGIATFAMPDAGEPIANPRHLDQKLARLRRYQRRNSRKIEAAKRTSGKTKGWPVSANLKKGFAKVARLHAQVRDARQDFLHKASTAIVHENQVVAMEDLAVTNMVRNAKLARSISDVAWSEFRRQVEYKAAWYGRTFVATDRWLPSSKRCSACGHLLASLALSVREWTCPACHTRHDRDRNAAINIRQAALACLGTGISYRGAHGKRRVAPNVCQT